MDKESEQSNESSGVVIPEEFQQQVHALVHKATKPHLDHIKSRVYSREDEIRNEEKPKASGKHPAEYSTENMPKGD